METYFFFTIFSNKGHIHTVVLIPYKSPYPWNKLFLYEMKYIDSANCTFCSNDQERIEHLFWNCPKVPQLVTNYLKQDNAIYMDLDISKMLFGYTKNSKSAKNILFILFKVYIYKCRTSKNTPTVTGVGNFISYKYKILKKSCY